MSLFNRNFRAFLLAGAASLLLAPQAFAAGSDFTVAPGASDTAAKTVGAGNTGAIGIGGALSASTPITWSLATGSTVAAVINNSGTINATSRGVDTSGSAAGAQSFTFNNLNASSSLNTSNDAFRVAGDIGGGNVAINNAGTIKSTGGRGFNFSVTNLNSLNSFALTNSGTVQSLTDTVRLTATNLQANATYNVSVDNSGTIQSIGTGSNNGQALDFNDLVSTTGTITITNQVTGVIKAADADAIRPGNNGTINNYGQIIANAAPGSTGNDAIDFQDTNAGTVNNFSTGSIIGQRDGITGKMAQTVVNAGIITGQAGSGINIDTTSGTMAITNSSTGVITGTIPAGSPADQDGDGVDVDYLANINNSGKILAVGMATGNATNEALAIGGGTITNNAGGLIQSDQRAITVDDSNLGNAFGAVTIDNAGTITGKNGEAIRITSAESNTLTNRATGVINGSVAMGGGNDTVNLNTGSTLNGALDTGGGDDTIHLLGTGSGTLSNVSNAESLKVDGGNWALSGGQSYASGVTVAAGATASVSGSLGGDVTNNGTVRVDGTTASFDGTFHNNGALVSDPATLAFNNLSTGHDGYIQAASGDLYKVGGDFRNASVQNSLWSTDTATLEFVGADGTSHILEIAGNNLGANLLGVTGNFGWGGLDIDSGNLVELVDGLGAGNGALYVTDLLGALISGDTITNISGIDGLTIYYNGNAADNAYLHGLNYILTGGGRLISDVPEPQSWTLLIAGFGLLGVMLRRQRRIGVPGALPLA